MTIRKYLLSKKLNLILWHNIKFINRLFCQMFDLSKEKETLYIIGNGFDLHHEIESRYSDFQRYLYNNGKSFLANNIEMFYPNVIGKGNHCKWGDLEMALGEVDVKTTYNECNEDIEKDDEHIERTFAIWEEKPQLILERLLSELQKYFELWVNDIDIRNIKPDNSIYQFSTLGKFLSFNYTETLETVYGVPREAITYIHGRRRCRDNLILGHNTKIDYHKYLTESEELFYKENAYKGIVQIANTKRKNVKDIIASKREFWNSIKAIKKLLLMGIHSLKLISRILNKYGNLFLLKQNGIWDITVPNMKRGLKSWLKIGV